MPGAPALASHWQRAVPLLPAPLPLAPAPLAPAAPLPAGARRLLLSNAQMSGLTLPNPPKVVQAVKAGWVTHIPLTTLMNAALCGLKQGQSSDHTATIANSGALTLLPASWDLNGKSALSIGNWMHTFPHLVSIIQAHFPEQDPGDASHWAAIWSEHGHKIREHPDLYTEGCWPVFLQYNIEVRHNFALGSEAFNPSMWQERVWSRLVMAWQMDRVNLLLAVPQLCAPRPNIPPMPLPPPTSAASSAVPSAAATAPAVPPPPPSSPSAMASGQLLPTSQFALPSMVPGGAPANPANSSTSALDAGRLTWLKPALESGLFHIITPLLWQQWAITLDDAGVLQEFADVPFSLRDG
ncbi:hypothetical protein CONPUDRAFT_151189 [Coniophora puteana RWD-64-598 SS2]|uniref:Uncharacterized protein n=1 Tax=Coniophora puteana (strain RWD-64-598) TaxID=741705 RepID=A0A5M3MZS4_CONPW|nr:uncharacterized protein CONPUDRAFT_151189 [Coniophora puteana RWD-64-598 SS2]EIW84145.1 hypothetical protein CONPUDRAFT_151189 [Coniophora puteana RWD-64-598 SS2]